MVSVPMTVVDILLEEEYGFSRILVGQLIDRQTGGLGEASGALGEYLEDDEAGLAIYWAFSIFFGDGLVRGKGDKC